MKIYYCRLFLIIILCTLCSLFVAVIVDNLARTQAAANATKSNSKTVKVYRPVTTEQVQSTLIVYSRCWRMKVLGRWVLVGAGHRQEQGQGESLLLKNTSLILSLTTTLQDMSYQRGVCPDNGILTECCVLQGTEAGW